MASNTRSRFNPRLSSICGRQINFRRAKKRLAPINQLNQCALYNITMKKYICILASAALLAACEQKTETTEPAASPAATTPATTTEATSPRATTTVTKITTIAASVTHTVES